MYVHKSKIKTIKTSMDQSDVKYILELLNDAVTNKDWDQVYDAKEVLIEFLDDGVVDKE